MSKLAAAVIAATVCPAALAGSYSTDFESFSTGSFVGQDGWRGNAVSGLSGGSHLDEEIVDVSGNRVFRLSNAVTSGNYDFTHPATPAVAKIGESPVGAPGIFRFSFDFMSASDSLQDGMRLDVTPFESFTASRQGIVRVYDNGTDGFSVGWWGYTSTFDFTPLATGLSRTDWHSISVEMNLSAGLGNDSVSIVLNSVATSGLTTWERYYATAGSPQPLVAPVDSLIFRAAGDPQGTVAGGGVYFDNVRVSATPVPTPGAAAAGLMLLGGIGGTNLMRRRRQA